jgi:putative two-component system response regulator
MQKQELPQDNDNDSEILEELAEVEAESELSDLGPEFSPSVHPRQSTLNGIELFSNPNLAFLILDPDLCIKYFTPKVELLFHDYYRIEAKPFFNIFNQALALDELKELVVALKSFEKGFSWTGVLKHKTPKRKTLHTRTTIVPFFISGQKIAGFQVFFEDITALEFKQLQMTFKSILEAAKLKDNDTGLHDERVSYYCKKMAEYLYAIQRYPQIDPDFIENIGFLAAMHDVGKIGTPDYILQKPGKLTEQEWEIMREHTINGTFILSSYPVPMAKEIALSHHEWWNGGGYPFKLEGVMIPLSARIVTIADVYDALRMKRTYKSEYTHEEAMRRIVAGSGTQFDPALVEVFVRMNTDFEDIWNLLKDTDAGVPNGRDRSKEFSESM